MATTRKTRSMTNRVEVGGGAESEKRQMLLEVKKEEVNKLRDIKVKEVCKARCFEFKGMAREQTSLAVLMDKVKPSLRLLPNEIVRWKNPLLSEYIENDTQFYEFWDNAMEDDEGWHVLEMKVCESKKRSSNSCSERSLNTGQTRSMRSRGGGDESELRCSECNARADSLWKSKCTPCFSRGVPDSGGGGGTSSSTPTIIKSNKISAAAAAATSSTSKPPQFIDLVDPIITTCPPPELNRNNKTSGGGTSSSSTPVIIKTHKTRDAAGTSSSTAKTTRTTTSGPPDIIHLHPTTTTSPPPELKSIKTSGGGTSYSSTPVIIKSHKSAAAAGTSPSTAKTTRTTTSGPPEHPTRTTCPPPELKSNNQAGGGGTSYSSTPVIIKSHKSAAAGTSSSTAKTTRTTTSEPPEHPTTTTSPPPQLKSNKTSGGGTSTSPPTELKSNSNTRAAGAGTSSTTETTPTTTSRPPEPKRRKLSDSPSSDHQQTPVSSSSSAMKLVRLSPDDQHGIAVSTEFVAAIDHLFQVMPQNPLLKPFENYPPTAQKGMRLILDLDFVNLATKFQKSLDPIEFYANTGDYSLKLTNLEELGYNVVKLRHKFDNLREISAKGKAVKDGIDETRGKIGVLEAEMTVGKKKINELEMQLQQLKAELKSESDEVEVIKRVEGKLSKDQDDITKAIISVATAPWI